MATVKDIAEMAGVSSMTVSNIINGRTEKVSAETFQRVSRIIKDLGYAPNVYAQILSNNASRMVAYIKVCGAPFENIGFMDNLFSAAFVDTIELSLSEIEYNLMLKTVSSADQLNSFLSSWRIDGVFIIGLCDESILNLLSSRSVPTVLIDTYIGNGNTSIQSINIDDEKGGFLATEHLLNHGHRKIAAISPFLYKNSLYLKRVAGYTRALEMYHVPLQQELVFDCRQMDIEQIVRKIADSGVTAVFALSDLLAVQLMKEMRRIGLKVPEDISLVGFDDTTLSTLSTPALTTIKQDTEEKERLVVAHMVKLLENPVTSVKQEIVMPVSLVERESVRMI